MNEKISETDQRFNIADDSEHQDTTWKDPTLPSQMDQAEGAENKSDDLIELQKLFITDHQDIFEQISKTNKIKFQPGNQFQIKFGKTISIELDARDWAEMKKGNFTEEEMIWSTLHEVAHFLDMTDDPEAMAKNFEYLAKKAKQRIPKVRQIWNDALINRGSMLPSYVTDEYLEKFIYDQLHCFYNCLDDIYVNRLVAQRLPYRYDSSVGSRAGVVENLYKRYLFPSSDFTNSPLSKQFGYALLRESMVGQEDTQIDSRVAETLDIKLNFGGKELTIKQILEMILQPSSKLIPKEQQNTLQKRYGVIQNFIEPYFWQLFYEDLKTFDPPQKIEKNDQGDKIDEEGSGAGGSFEPPPINDDEKDEEDKENESDGRHENESESSDKDDKSENKDSEKSNQEEDQIPEDGKGNGQGTDDQKSEKESTEKGEGGGANPWEDINKPSPLDAKITKDFLDSKAESQGENESEVIDMGEKLSPTELLKEHKIRYDASLVEAYAQLTPERARELAEEWQQLSELVKPYIEELSQVFDMIMNTINSQIIQAWQDGFRSGKLNIPYFIKKYGSALAAGVETGDFRQYIDFSKLDTYAQKEFTSRLKIYPNEITLRLILDKSGSMEESLIVDENEGQKQNKISKIYIVKELLVLIYQAVKSFEARVNHNFRLNEPFRIDLEVQAFSDKTVHAKELGFFGEKERAMMLATLGYLQPGGGTDDAQAWSNIIAQLAGNQEKVTKFKNGQAQDITIEVTDGDTSTAVRTKQNIQQYLDLAGEGSASGIKIVNAGETIEKYKQSIFYSIFEGSGRPVKSASELTSAMIDLLSEKFLHLIETIKVKQETADDFDDNDEFVQNI